MTMLTSPETPKLPSHLTEITCACLCIDVELVYKSSGDTCVDLKWKECHIELSLHTQIMLGYMINDLSPKSSNPTKISGFAVFKSK